MKLESLLNGPILFAIALVVLLGIWLVWPRRRQPPAEPRGPTGVGAALAHALDGDLPRARVLLTQQVRVCPLDEPDAVLGLIAVLRAQRDFSRAAAIVRGLRARTSAPWIDALCVRLCLDAGQPEKAASFVNGRTPPDLAIAAFARAGRWSEAISRLGRATRSAEIEAGLYAGWAAQLLAAGDERGGRKRLKRATSLAADNCAVLVATQRHAPKESDRASAEARLARRLGRTLTQRSDIDPHVQALLDEADARVEAEDVETALGLLRDALDREPTAERVRRRYEALLVEYGEPEDWRAALAERAEREPTPTPLAGPPRLGCAACGLQAEAPFFVCPRCDRFDTVAIVDATPPVGVEPSLRGARLDDLA